MGHPQQHHFHLNVKGAAHTHRQANAMTVGNTFLEFALKIKFEEAFMNHVLINSIYST